MEKRKIRIQDIAQQAGVSNATVSRVLNNQGLVNGETYRKVLDAMNALGYPHTLRVSTSSGKSSSPDLIILSLPAISNPFYYEIAVGAQDAAKRFGYRVLISNSPLDADGLEQLTALAKSNAVAGVISLNSMTSATLERLCAVTHVIQCCEYCDGSNVPFVSINDYQATRTALAHLYSHGRKDIALINGPLGFKYARHRQAAYLDFLQENRLPIREDWIIQLSSVDFSIAVASLTQLLSRPNPPDAIFAISDVFAVAAVKVAKKCGLRIPQDLMIVGFDNIDVSYMFEPTITTVNQPKQQLGYMACELLVEQISNPEAPLKQLFLDTELIVRESTTD